MPFSRSEQAAQNRPLGRRTRSPIDLQFSAAKAERIVAEFDRVIALLEINPLLFPERRSGWRIYPFDSGTYLLYYRELASVWLIVGVFHASRHPSWVMEQLSGRG